MNKRAKRQKNGNNKEAKNNSTGRTGIPAEPIEERGPPPEDRIIKLIKRIRQQEEWPNEWNSAVIFAGVLRLDQKNLVCRTIIRPTVLYGSETWIID